MRILFIGDIFGRPGRNIVQEKLAGLVKDQAIDLIIANGENSAAGFGITGPLAEDLFDLGIDVLSTGNHIWDKREIIDYFQMADGNPHSPARRLLRPANYAPDLPGWGWYEGVKGAFHYAVINLQGRVFMASNEDPFRAADQLIKMTTAKLIFVDMHAEATSEKGAMGWHLAGRASAVIGTHTHVQTSDERILEPGTAFLTDAGMCGPIDSVIGVKRELAIRRFITHLPTRFEPAAGRTVVQGAVISVDPASGRASAISRVQEYVDRP